ncbi:MAG: trypsin-like peptidase domain-containing protein [Salinivirgaceae bacterium]|jgi:lysyl endopeptidase|nr:trypsin-like peptidase domain-containing protein [Salinivirgaceae bacterium]
MKNIIASTLIIIISFSYTFAQISRGGLPYSWKENLQNNISTINLGKVSTPKAISSNQTKNGSFTFAELIEVNKSSDNAGTWTELANGDKLWQLRIKSEGAYSLNFTFDKYLVPEGSELFVYSPDRAFKLGAFTHENNKESGILAVAAIPGDEIIIEYYQSEDAEFQGELTVGTIGHDYLNIFGLKDGQFGKSGECNIDINCTEGDNWQDHKRAVCRMISNNTGLCTGTLLNNTNKDQTPYILTADHCFINGKTPENTVYYFNYESPSCNGSDGSVAQTISGSELIAVKNNGGSYLDFTLVELSALVPVSYKPFFAGWDSRGLAPEQSACIHHPWGDVKKISIDNNAAEQGSYEGYGYDTQTFWKILEWDAGMTQGGSSGSALLNQDGRVVGLLSGGDSRDCNDEPLNDYYQMFSVAFDKYAADTNQLKHWLDPIDSGVKVLNSLDTYNGDINVENLAFISHWQEGQEFKKYTASNGGFISGNNAYQDRAKAEFFNKNEFGDRNVIINAKLAFFYATGNDDTFIELQILSDENGKPSTLLGSSFVKLKYIKEVVDRDYSIFEFNPPVEINSSVYLSVVLPQNEGDTVAILTADESDINTAWELNYNDEWIPYSDTEKSWGKSLSHIMKLEVGNFSSINNIANKFSELNIYPNPVIDKINIPINKKTTPPVIVNIYNSVGSVVYSHSFNNIDKEIQLNLSDLKNGFYVLTISSDYALYSGKFMKE